MTSLKNTSFKDIKERLELLRTQAVLDAKSLELMAIIEMLIDKLEKGSA